jgi:hypothetical protein
MRRHRLELAAVAALFLVPRAAAAAEWWVDQAAAAGGDGSAASPFVTLNEAKSVLQTGDTVWVRNGTYQETVDFWHVPTGTDGRTTIRAEAGHSPVIDGGGTDGFVLQAGETPKMTFQGLTVRNGGSGFHFYYADDGEVLDCRTEATGGAVSFYFASRGRVSGSVLEGSVSGKASDGTVLEDNEIFGSGAEGITLHADSKNCRYSRNVVHDNTSVNIYLDAISDTVVDSNLVYMTDPNAGEAIGIMLADESYENVTAPVLQNITITNNVIVNNESGIRFWDGHFPGQSALRNVLIAHNTVVNNVTSAIKWDAGPHVGTVVRDNVFAAESGKGLLMLQANSLDGITLDHNLWYLPGIEAPFLWGATTYDHAGWAAATGHGAGDVDADPLFAGAWTLPAQNLRLTESSPAVDAGEAIAEVTHDFDGASRPWGPSPDLGAFEFGASVGGSGGAGASGGTGVDGGSGGTGATGASSAGGDATGGLGGAAASGDDVDDGCGCRAAGRSWSRLGLVGMLALVGLASRRRRARR